MPPSTRELSVSALPKAFRILQPHELEDVFSIFNYKFKAALAEPPGQDRTDDESNEETDSRSNA